MKIFLGADHRGFELKNLVFNLLQSLGYEVEDCGNSIFDEDDDYPDFAKAVCQKLFSNHEDRGILFCGSGVGMDIAANRFADIRSGLGINLDQVRSARHDDDINVLVLAADHIDINTAKNLISTFLETEFSGSFKHLRRLEKINLL